MERREVRTHPMIRKSQHSSLIKTSFAPLPLRLSIRWASGVCPGAGATVPPPSKATSPSASCPPWWAKARSCSELPPFPALSKAASDQQPGRCWRVEGKWRAGAEEEMGD